MKVQYIFNLGSDIIKVKCNFAYYFNNTDIKPTVLDDGNKIILENWPDNKYIICNVNNDISVEIPSFPYVLVNRSVSCNCGIVLCNILLPVNHYTGNSATKSYRRSYE